MKRQLALLKANLRCAWYLLTFGMWRGHCRSIREVGGKTVRIEAIRGGWSPCFDKEEVVETFYEEKA